MGNSIIHIIPSLKTGGAESMLCKIVKHSSGKHVVYYLDEGPLRKKLLDNGVRVVKFKTDFHLIFHLLFKRKQLVMVAWLYRSCLIAGLVKIFKPKSCVIFNHRNSLGPENRIKLSRKISLFFIKQFSKVVDAAIFNSNNGLRTYSELGIVARRQLTLQNGFDLSFFYPPLESKERLRVRNGFENCTGLMYLVSARNSPEKQLSMIIDVFYEFSLHKKNVSLVICGRETEHLELPKGVDNIYCVGEVDNIASYYQMSDFAILYSTTEGFPNVIGEAMACGLPCISTDVGDCGELVDGSGWVCTSGTSQELSDALFFSSKICSSDYQARSKKAVGLIREHYGIDVVCKKFMNFVEAVNEYK